MSEVQLAHIEDERLFKFRADGLPVDPTLQLATGATSATIDWRRRRRPQQAQAAKRVGSAAEISRHEISSLRGAETVHLD